MKPLKTGVAYHGNRMPSHYRDDLAEMSKADMDIVVHMFSHTDWDRHHLVMKDIFKMTEDAGLEVWVDNWGIGGPPGDKTFFLGLHPEAHMIYSNGKMHPTKVCVNSPAYRKFVKEWIDTVAEIGGKTIFWDEPTMPSEKNADTDDTIYCCTCPECQKKFEERYNKKMPEFLDDDTREFRLASIVDFFGEVTDYSASLGMKNAACVMLEERHGINLDTIGRICSLPHLDDIGSDPYWTGHRDRPVYEYVYTNSKKNIDIADKYGKDHNLWIQAFGLGRGTEDDVITACEAAYDAGARTILGWAFHGSESNTYRAHNPERTWNKLVEGMRRVKQMEYDRILAENRAKYMK